MFFGWAVCASVLSWFFQKWADPGLFFIYFRLFKHKLQFFQQINVEKCPSSIGCRDLNSRPLEYESPPITTRPGLPAKLTTYLYLIPRYHSFMYKATWPFCKWFNISWKVFKHQQNLNSILNPFLALILDHLMFSAFKYFCLFKYMRGLKVKVPGQCFAHFGSFQVIFTQ